MYIRYTFWDTRKAELNVEYDNMNTIIKIYSQNNYYRVLQTWIKFYVFFINNN